MDKIIVFLPDWSKGNPYQERLASALTAHACHVRFMDYPSALFPLNEVLDKTPDCAVIHLHWVNALVDPIVWCKNPIKRYVKLLILATDILWARMRRRRIIWTVHNLVSHESKNPEVEIQARRLVAKNCSHILVHSASALQLLERTYQVDISCKVTVAPHGNYDGCYPVTLGNVERLGKQWNVEPDDVVILFFGAIRRYKGVERLINAFRSVGREKLKLVIAGNCSDHLFSQHIISAATEDSRIIPAIRFIPEEDVGALFSLADIVALPFERTLTSGSATLACTMGKALLVPEEARVFDFLNDENTIFFDTDDRLIKCIGELEKKQLAGKGLKAREAVEDFSWANVSSRVARAYKT